MFIEKLKALKDSDKLWLEYDHAAAEQEAYKKQIKEEGDAREKAGLEQGLKQGLEQG